MSRGRSTVQSGRSPKIRPRAPQLVLQHGVGGFGDVGRQKAVIELDGRVHISVSTEYRLPSTIEIDAAGR